MAIITLCGRRHMSWVLSGSAYTIVAIRTVAGSIGVIELYCQPVALGSMTGITFRACRHMVSRLAGSRGAVMTAGADTNRHRMVEAYGGPIAL